jgi:hypothetical protein
MKARNDVMIKTSQIPVLPLLSINDHKPNLKNKEHFLSYFFKNHIPMAKTRLSHKPSSFIKVSYLLSSYSVLQVL